jgi:putative hemolysin
VVWLLSISTNAVVRLLGGDPSAKSEAMTDEELRDLVVAHEGLHDDERAILKDVFDAADRSLGEVMRPRVDVVFLPRNMSVSEATALVRDKPHSRYPVIREGFDDVVGFLHVRDLLHAPPDAVVGDLMRQILLLPSTNRLLPSLSRMRGEGVHIAVVVDEYGGTDGIVTLEDLVEELVGEIWDEYDRHEAALHRSADGVISIDAGLTIEEFTEHTAIPIPDGPYETVAGYVIDRLGRLAAVGDAISLDGHDIVVSAVDNRRILRLEVRASPDAEPALPAATPSDDERR